MTNIAPNPNSEEDIRQTVEGANRIRHTIYLMVNAFPARYLFGDDVWIVPRASEADYSISIGIDYFVRCWIKVPTAPDMYIKFKVPIEDVVRYVPVHPDLARWPQEAKHLLPTLRTAGLEPRIHYNEEIGVNMWVLWDIEDDFWAGV